MTMTDADLAALMQPIYAELAADFKNLVNSPDRPLLAHYTSIDSIEKILRSGEIWFSNPMFMNDLQEVRGGIRLATEIFMTSSDLNVAAGSNDRAKILRDAYFHYITDFEAKHLLDVYVFCVSEHDRADWDGRLSMWRGYGSSGNGAALIFDTTFVTENENSPLLFVKVKYKTDEERRDWFKEKFEKFCNIIANGNIADTDLYKISFQYFHLIKFESLCTKHKGFQEESEWRVIYMPERDKDGILKESFGYSVGRNGVEPKLKFVVKPLPFKEPKSWTFSEIIDRIILGPTAARPLAVESVRRMLEKIEKPELKDKVRVSTIPLRPS